MMGYGEDKGIIPMCCSELFNRIGQNSDPNVTYGAEVSYIEIYNEKVHDLLNPKNKGNLKVREHPSTGPYVEDLSRLVVGSFDDINHLMDEGNKARTVAATNMNETSSRSHAVFTVFLTQKRRDELTKLETEKVARISLVDLAGSERANSTGATGARLKEGANINRSLTTLGKVIAGLAEQSMSDGGGKGGKKKKEVFIPYRDSVLTWLLKDSLGGNSKTAMIAAISPADYDETLSTLRYADQAKKIKNKAVVNEDPNAKMIRELKEELEVLRNRLHVYAPDVVEELAANSSIKINKNLSTDSKHPNQPSPSRSILTNGDQEFEYMDATGNKKKMTKTEIVDQLQSSEKLLANLNESWEDKLKKTESIQVERERALEELGITVHKDNVGVYAPKKMPHLVNLNEDPLMSECLMYQIKPGITHVGRNETEMQKSSHNNEEKTGKEFSTITLGGSKIDDDHCWFDNINGVVTLHPKKDSLVMVNGMRISEPRQLHSGFRIILGDFHIFRFNHPEEVRKEREKAASMLISTSDCQQQPLEIDTNVGHILESPTTLTSGPTTLGGGSELMDWNYARLEAVRNYYSKEGNFNEMEDEELEKLFDEVTKIRKSRRNTRCGSLVSFDDFSTRSSTDLDTTTSTLVNHNNSNNNVIGQTQYEEKIMIEKEKLKKELDSQKQFYEAKINRLSMQFSTGDTSILNNMNNAILFNDHKRELLQKVFKRWKGLQYVSMAEVVLTNAVILKEANVISKKLEKETTYQFTVIEGGQFTNPLSYWESASDSNNHNINDEDESLLKTQKPCVGVRVIDRKHQSVYVWSLQKLKNRLEQMKTMLNGEEDNNNNNNKSIQRNRNHQHHPTWIDPFYNHQCPQYTMIGSAPVSARSLFLQQPYESNVEIICRSTGQVKGKLKLLISPVIAKPPSASLSHEVDSITGIQKKEEYLSQFSSTNNNTTVVLPQPKERSTPAQLKLGQQLVFEIRLLELCGINESEFTKVHVQFRLSSFGSIPASTTAEKLFASDPISGFEGNLIIPLDYSQTLSMVVNENMLKVLQYDIISFEIYGTAQSRVLDQYERWDDQREKPRLADLLAASNNNTNNDNDNNINNINTNNINISDNNNKKDDRHIQSSLPLTSSSNSSSSNITVEKRSDDDMMTVETHDITAWVQFSELLPNGDYMPVQSLTEHALDRGVFNLRQGLQRRITITLSHNSGHQFKWNRISKVTVGKIRMLDAKGRIVDAQHSDDIPLKLIAQQHAVVYNNDGTSQLVAQGAWDSSQHECLFLNRLTLSRTRILLHLIWDVETEKCSKPIQFSMDVAIRIVRRDSNTNGPTTAFRLKKLLGTASGSKYLTKHCSLFSVQLRPPMTRRASQLWRLNTATKYIRGEELLLGSWRPRGVSLIHDFKHIRERIYLKEQVMFTSQVLTLHAARSQTSEGSMAKERYNKEPSNKNRNNDTKQHALLNKVLNLWSLKLGSDKEIQITQNPPIPGMREMNNINDNIWKGTKLLAEVKLISQTNNITKKGYLSYQEDPLVDKWIKRWCVIRRPYIYIYAHQNEQDEVGVINISSVRVDNNKALEKLLQRHHVISLYTNNNAYTLQAGTKSDMLDWISKLDQNGDTQQQQQ
ncbi:unnamed protein product [Cunninghamella blakesleeana]